MYMHQFGWLSERGGNFLNLLQKEGYTQKLGGSLRKGGGGAPTLEETISFIVVENMCTAESKIGFE